MNEERADSVVMKAVAIHGASLIGLASVGTRTTRDPLLFGASMDKQLVARFRLLGVNYWATLSQARDAVAGCYDGKPVGASECGLCMRVLAERRKQAAELA